MQRVSSRVHTINEMTLSFINKLSFANWRHNLKAEKLEEFLKVKIYAKCINDPDKVTSKFSTL